MMKFEAKVQNVSQRSAPTLPAHLVPVGEQHQLNRSHWWIGRVRPAYEEVSHLHGVVIYDRESYLFLSAAEAEEVQTFLQQMRVCPSTAPSGHRMGKIIVHTMVKATFSSLKRRILSPMGEFWG